MAKNTGRLVTAPIRVNDDKDTYASAYANEICGGLHTITKLEELNKISSKRQVLGMLCFCRYTDTYYKLTKLYDKPLDTSDESSADYYINYWTITNINKNDGGVYQSELLDSVISITTSQPTNPKKGDRYIIGVGGSIETTDAWKGKETQITEYNGNVWMFDIPKNGTTVNVDNTYNVAYTYRGDYGNGGIWTKDRINQVLYISAVYDADNNNYDAIINDTKLASYNNETIFITKLDNKNNKPSPTLNINNLGKNEIKRINNGSLNSISSGDLTYNYYYMVIYDGECFELYDNVSDVGSSLTNDYYVPNTKDINVPQNAQYLIYGDLTVDGNISNDGHIIIINGDLINNGTVKDVGDDSYTKLVSFAEINGLGVNNYIPRWKSNYMLTATSSIYDDGNKVTVISPFQLESNITIPNGAVDGYVLTSDSIGNVTWKAPNGGGSNLKKVSVNVDINTGSAEIINEYGTKLFIQIWNSNGMNVSIPIKITDEKIYFPSNVDIGTCTVVIIY